MDKAQGRSQQSQIRDCQYCGKTQKILERCVSWWGDVMVSGEM